MIWCSPTSVGTPRLKESTQGLREIADRAGCRNPFHELRDVFAAIAASEVSMAQLSKILGHRRPATTSDIYAHLYDPMRSRLPRPFPMCSDVYRAVECATVVRRVRGRAS